MTTEEIAERLNYSDAANFRHAFKRWTGRSPKEYRLINRVRISLPYSGGERREKAMHKKHYAGHPSF
ncbi:Bacterial regulatory helix-turn-helix protein, AraC family [compost metagenome]